MNNSFIDAVFILEVIIAVGMELLMRGILKITFALRVCFLTDSFRGFFNPFEWRFACAVSNHGFIMQIAEVWRWV